VTEQQKCRLLAAFLERAKVAEANGLPMTAKSWRDLHLNLLGRDAAAIVFVDRNPDEQTFVA
jgi:hypothetical protein